MLIFPSGSLTRAVNPWPFLHIVFRLPLSVPFGAFTDYIDQEVPTADDFSDKF